MGVQNYKKFQNGYNLIVSEDSDMNVEFGILAMEKNKKVTVESHENEIVVLLVQGNVEFIIENNSYLAKRSNCFDDLPSALHVPRGCVFEIISAAESECIVVKKRNSKKFPIKFYSTVTIQTGTFGDGILNNTAKRDVRIVFDFFNAPYSKFVIGELVTYPGRWSSYPPHSHPHPEIYYYRFSKEQGFGCSIIGDEAYVVRDRSVALIKGGENAPTHPQVAAPGYAMYYCWI
ncbi:MAG: 5-deoxy-glucuronate isomerase, partial [Fusobacteria bacterium]|nr:5-deoxy-glucuronate isomerase [Fusobacteriota bacterium]